MQKWTQQTQPELELGMMIPLSTMLYAHSIYYNFLKTKLFLHITTESNLQIWMMHQTEKSFFLNKELKFQTIKKTEESIG